MTSKASTLFATTASFGMLAPWLGCPLDCSGACRACRACGGGDLRNALCLMAELPISAPHVFIGACSFHVRAFSFSFHGMKQSFFWVFATEARWSPCRTWGLLA